MENMERIKKNFWKDRRVFLTGATGMLGSWMVKELLRLDSYIVVLIRDGDPQSELTRSHDIRRVSVVNGALEDFFSLERAINEHEIDTVFHLGAQTIIGTAERFPLLTFEANIRGTYNLLEVCRMHKDLVKRLVVASSDKAYGEQPRLPYTEDMPLRGRYPYEVSKSCADLITQSYHHAYELPVAIVRCGNIYGGGDLNWSRIVPGTIRSFLQGESPVIRSDGKFVRDYVYVKDVARVYLDLAERLNEKKMRGEAFNFSMESPLTVLDIVKIIQDLMKCPHLKPKILNLGQGEIHSQYLSSAKLRKMLKVKPQFYIQRGLSETIGWYREFFDRKY